MTTEPAGCILKYGELPQIGPKESITPQKRKKKKKGEDQS